MTAAARATHTDVTGLILAGGLGRRMSADGRGTNKALQLFRGRPMLAHVLERLQPQVTNVLINANDRIAEFECFTCPIIGDRFAGYQGPLAGLHAGLVSCATGWLITAPCDSPFLPLDLVSRLMHAQQQHSAQIAVASCDGQLHPVFALVATNLQSSLEAFLATGQRKIDRWFDTQKTVVAEFDNASAFLNVNTMADLRRYEGDL